MQDVLAAALMNDPRVQFAYLFGSRARGTEREGSDADVAVWLDGERGSFGAAALELIDVLGAAVGVDVDVVVLNQAPLLLRWQVLRHGRLLLERNRTRRVGFEALTMQQALDFESIRRRCSEGMIRKLRQETDHGG
jgi:predicted nucleotidyltransferase